MSTKHQSHQPLLHYWSSLDWGAVCLNGFDSVTEPHSVTYYGHGRQLLRMWRVLNLYSAVLNDIVNAVPVYF